MEQITGGFMDYAAWQELEQNLMAKETTPRQDMDDILTKTLYAIIEDGKRRALAEEAGQ